MLSVVIGHVPYGEEAETMLDKCRTSIAGQWDELILVVNDGIGYGQTFNRGAKFSTGEYVFLISNDTELVQGKLEDLMNPDEVTTPLVNENTTQFGCFVCIPRKIYKQVGLFDERFEGAYWEDEDLLRRWKQVGIPLTRIDSVQVLHEGGKTVKAVMNETSLYVENRHKFIDKWGHE